MASQKDLDTVHIQAVVRYATLSRARRLKVGALIVTETGVIVPGFNGTPPGFDNNCEYEDENYNLVTKDIVIHAEMNAILKAAKEGISLKNSTVYCTHTPCRQCAAKMVALGIKRFVYKDSYKDDSGLTVLDEGFIEINKFVKGHNRRDDSRYLKK